MARATIWFAAVSSATRTFRLRPSGAGAGAQKAIGTSVLGGMISGTFLAVLFIPLFYVVVVRLFSRERKHETAAPPETPVPAEGN